MAKSHLPSNLMLPLSSIWCGRGANQLTWAKSTEDLITLSILQLWHEIECQMAKDEWHWGNCPFDQQENPAILLVIFARWDCSEVAVQQQEVSQWLQNSKHVLINFHLLHDGADVSSVRFKFWKLVPGVQHVVKLGGNLVENLTTCALAPVHFLL